MQTEFGWRCLLGIHTGDRSGKVAGLGGKTSWDVMQAGWSLSQLSQGLWSRNYHSCMLAPSWNSRPFTHPQMWAAQGRLRAGGRSYLYLALVKELWEGRNHVLCNWGWPCKSWQRLVGDLTSCSQAASPSLKIWAMQFRVYHGTCVCMCPYVCACVCMRGNYNP